MWRGERNRGSVEKGRKGEEYEIKEGRKDFVKEESDLYIHTYIRT